jgi:hypothetical protein
LHLMMTMCMLKILANQSMYLKQKKKSYIINYDQYNLGV